MQITINEIAKRAGVGVGTVSRYINKKPHVSIDKANKIQEVIDQYDYVPSAIGTQLRTQSTGTIGLLVSRVTNPFFATLFDKIERRLNSLGYQVIVSQTHDDPEAEKRFLMQLQTQKVDGILLASIENPDLISQVAKKFQSRMVLLNEQIEGANIPAVVLNHYQATYNTLTYLYDKGYHTIAYATGGSYANGRHGRTRNQAYKDFCRAHQLETNSKFVFEKQHTIQDGRKIAKKISKYSISQLPRCIFANSDEVAIGVIYELQRLGIRVPEDVAVVGYDDQPMAEFVQVPLTTIRQPVDQIVDKGVKLLLQGLNGEDVDSGGTTLALELIVRDSA